MHHLLFIIQYICSLAVFTWPIFSFATEPYYIQYTRSNGFISEDAIYIRQDSKTKLWIGTSHGMCSFNGIQFNSIPNTGLNSTSILWIDEDSLGIKWITTAKNGIYRYEDSVYVTTPATKAWTYEEPIRWVNQLNAFSNGHLFLNTQDRSYWLSDTSIDYLTPNKPIPNLLLNNTSSFKGGVAFIQEDSGSVAVIFNGKLISIPIVFPPKEQRLLNHRFFFGSSDSAFAVTYRNTMHLYQNGAIRKIKLPSYATHSICFLNNKTVLLGTEKHGVLYIENGEITDSFLNDFKVYDIVEDIEKGIWIGTEGNGLLYIPNLELKWYQKGEPIDWIQAYRDSVLYVTNSGNIYHGNQQIGATGIQQNQIHKLKWGICRDSASIHYAYTRIDDTVKHAWGIIQLPDCQITERPWVGLLLSSLIVGSDTLLGANSGLWVLDRDIPVNLIESSSVVSKWASDMEMDLEDSLTFWVTTFNGIQKIKSRKGEAIPFVLEEEHYTELTFNKIFRFKDWLIASAKQYPLHIKTKGSNEFKPAANWPELTVNCYFIKDNTCFIGTYDGLYRLSKVADKLELINVSNAIGLSPTYVQEITAVDETLFLATKGGILSMPLGLAQKAVSTYTHAYLQHVKVNQQFLLPNAFFELYTNDKLSFIIETVGYRSRNDRRYAYRLLPVDTNWSYTNQAERSFYNLAAGNYKLEIRSLRGETSTYPFLVKAYFHQRFWVRFSGIVLLILLLLAPIYYNRRLKLQKLQFESSKKELQLRSLSAQLNPHFIFNALTSIQSFVLNREARQSSDYLATFANYIRSVLHHARYTQVSLENAIESIKTYLDLEQLRLNESFTYTIKVDPSIQPAQVMIPPMLLQPYVENAVIHGVTGLPYPGKILISIERTLDWECIIRIVDNGTGLMSNKSVETKGFGLSTNINQKRMDLLNQVYHSSFHVTITSNQKSKGVTCTLYIKHSNG